MQIYIRQAIVAHQAARLDFPISEVSMFKCSSCNVRCSNGRIAELKIGYHLEAVLGSRIFCFCMHQHRFAGPKTTVLVPTQVC